MADKLNLLSGTAVQTEKGYFYIKNHVRVHIPSRRVFQSWNFRKVVKTTEKKLSHYPVMGTLGFRDGTLVYCIADTTYYIVSNKELVLVDSPDMLVDHGYNRFGIDAIWISKRDRDLHKRREP